MTNIEKTEWISGYYTSHPKFGNSLSINLTKYPEFRKITEDYNLKVSSSKNGNEYCRLKFIENFKIL